MKISAVLITLNDQANIDPCLDSLRWVDEIIVLDRGSEDRTIEKVKAQGGKLFAARKDSSNLKGEALEKANGDWIFFLEANERVPSDLAREIQGIISKPSSPCAYAIKRETSFFERKLSYCGTQNDVHVRLWPRGKVLLKSANTNAVETDLPIRELRKKIIMYGIQNRRHYRQMVEKFMALEVGQLSKHRSEVRVRDYTLRPLAVFSSIYILKWGFLDGYAGFQYAYLTAHYEYLKFYSLKKKLEFEMLGVGSESC